MHPLRTLCFSPLLALTLLTSCNGQEDEADTLPPAPALTPPPHAVFEHWHEVLMAQSEPRTLFRYEEQDGREPTEEEKNEVEEVRYHIAHALEAAKTLYRTRMAFFHTALNRPDGSLSRDEEKKEDIIASCETLLAEGFRRDLEALSYQGTWMDEGTVEPSTRPGRQELLFRPALNAFAFRQVHGCMVEISSNYCQLNDIWEKHQDAALAKLLADYGNGIHAAMREPFTGDLWENGSHPHPELAPYRASMQTCIHQMREAWVAYRDAMLQLVCPCHGFRGSGEGIFMSLYESYLLDSRERFLCMLEAGAHGLHKLSDIPAERSGALLELHPKHRFGELFSADARLFRHPKLEGNPWCLRFEGCGAGFILVRDGVALRQFAEQHPQGGATVVYGYQSLECVGTPYEQVAGSSWESTLPRPDGGLKPQQVFHLLKCKTNGEGEEGR